MLIKLIRIFILVTCSMALEEKDLICSDEFCKKYIADKGCPELSEACKVQNSTHNGVYLPYPDICNCCDYCITNLGLNEVCSRGSPGMPPPPAICGPSLICTSNKGGSATCQPMKTDCINKQAEWDARREKGTLGMTEVRPQCDDDGIFMPVHCIPGSICYCLSTDGKRIFGEMPFLHPSDEFKMTCGCSLNNWKALKSISPEFIDETLPARCNEYGLYDSLQCMMGNEADCFCVNPITGEPYSDVNSVPVTDLKPGKPTCFDSKIHVEGTYRSECENMKAKWHENLSTTTISSVRIGEFENPKCQPDGKFHRLQKFEKKHVCVDPSGEQIEKFEALVDTTDANSMDCNCARARWMLGNAGVTELPICCENGNYKAWQCRRKECFCVDCNGDQNGIEVDIDDITKLPCYNDNKPCALSCS